MSLSKLCNLPLLARRIASYINGLYGKGWMVSVRRFSGPFGPLKPLSISEKKGNSRELQKLKNESKIATNNYAGG
tara:strand:- start:2535 stop:2759 length:225 start_codon:yes stop_codon:yes gene_type:complete